MARDKPRYDGHNRKPVKVKMRDLRNRQRRRKGKRGLQEYFQDWERHYLAPLRYLNTED